MTLQKDFMNSSTVVGAAQNDTGHDPLTSGKWHRIILDEGGYIISGGDLFMNALSGGRFVDILSEECRGKFVNLMAGTVVDGEADIFITSDGYPLEMMVIPLGSRCMLFCRDCDIRVGNPERLAFFYRNFLNTPSAICITDEEGHILEANRSFLELYGYTSEEVVGENPRVLKSGRESPDIYTEMWRQITDPSIEKWSGEIINRKKMGKKSQYT
jgi:PAS domain S-box-containing protein